MIVNKVLLLLSNYPIPNNNFIIKNHVLILLINNGDLPSFIISNQTFYLEIESKKIKKIKSKKLYFDKYLTLIITKYPFRTTGRLNKKVIYIEEDNKNQDDKTILNISFRSNENKLLIKRKIQLKLGKFIDYIITIVIKNISFTYLIIIFFDNIKIIFNDIISYITIETPLKFILYIIGNEITNKQNHIIKTYVHFIVIIFFKFQNYLIENDFLFFQFLDLIYKIYTDLPGHISTTIYHNLLFFHILCCYRIIKLVYSNLIKIIINIIDILRGKNYNILKSRYDTVEYSTDKIIVSTIMFSISVLVLINLIQYYFSFCSILLFIEIFRIFLRFSILLFLNPIYHYNKFKLIKNEEIYVLTPSNITYMDRINLSLDIAFKLSQLKYNGIKQILLGQ